MRGAWPVTGRLAPSRPNGAIPQPLSLLVSPPRRFSPDALAGLSPAAPGAATISSAELEHGGIEKSEANDCTVTAPVESS